MGRHKGATLGGEALDGATLGGEALDGATQRGDSKWRHRGATQMAEGSAQGTAHDTTPPVWALAGHCLSEGVSAYPPDLSLQGRLVARS